MKKIYILLLLCVSSVYSQERVDDYKFDFLSNTYEVKRPKLYSYSEVDAKWNDLKEGYYNDFTNMTFYKAEYNGTAYYILRFKVKQIVYRYPNLKMDPYVIKKSIGYIFSQQEYDKLKIYQDITSYSFEISTYTNNDDEFRRITFSHIKTLNAKNDNLEYSPYILKIKKENENVVRFMIPDTNEKITLDKKYFEIEKKQFDKLLTLK